MMAFLGPVAAGCAVASTGFALVDFATAESQKDYAEAILGLLPVGRGRVGKLGETLMWSKYDRLRREDLFAEANDLRNRTLGTLRSLQSRQLTQYVDPVAYTNDARGFAEDMGAPPMLADDWTFRRENAGTW